MKDKTETPAAADPLFKVEILINGILIDDAHHAKGKVMSLAKTKAETLAAMTPPAVRIVGI